MSRTLKDKPSKLLWGRYDQDYIPLEGYYHIWRKTTKPKVRRTKDTEWAWMQSTPSWWNNLFHNRPIRRKFSNYCTIAVGYEVEALEEMLEPSDSRKPHKYYW